ncbi:transmembrane and ubiquitin-like domain-containing protein 1 [Euwallacea fornicatus]|uniref:transmembrane and ubiquitin-like domain-containing protein 1 n=1 Tax=Euwallacea fornicatus TaxID=995702 RepID=UPI00338E7207
MSLIEGIGDEVTQFFLILFAAVVAYIAWWSTSTTDPRQVRTVLLLDRRRHSGRSILRVRVPPRRLTNYTESITITEGSAANSSTSVQTEITEEAPETATQTTTTESPNENPSVSNICETHPPEESDDSSSVNTESSLQVQTSDMEETDIIETMDADAQSQLRQRRIAHFVGAVETPQTSFVTDSKVAQKPQDSQEDNTITIKLKYINDNIRAVDGRLEELLGDFKRRHFEGELNSNKEVKLIFNGHVLKQNQQSLQNCGLFDNCVVHCLIHQKRPTLGDRAQENVNESGPQFPRNNNFPHIVNVNNNNQGIDWDLGNFLFAIVSFILLTAWYFRYVYAHLYTVTATIGLIIITGIFSIVLVGAYLPNDDYQQQPNTNLRIRVSRTQRIEEQQQ